jgi:hypothetical protein
MAGSHFQAGRKARPAEAKVGMKAIKGLLGQLISIFFSG